MPLFPYLTHASEMAQAIRQKNWTETPMGDPAAWPIELKTALGILVESRFPKAIVWGPSLTTFYNDAFRIILGEKPEPLGKPFSEIWAEVWSDIGPLVDETRAGKAVFIENFPLQILRGDRPERAYFTFCYSPIRMADGAVGGIMDTVIETTEAVKAMAEKELVTAELGHRLKNTMTLVQAISRQTLKGIKDRTAVEAFDERLRALSAAHETLLHQDWERASMQSVIRETLSAISDLSRFDLTGPDVDLGPKSVLGLSMLLHELATNAAKYGALSSHGGRVRIACEIEGDRHVLWWKETGGPPVSVPAKTGFGSRIIAMGLGGSVKIDFEPSGLVVRIETQLADLQASLNAKSANSSN